MKKFHFLLVLLSISIITKSTEWVGVGPNKQAPAQITLDYSNVETSEISITLSGFLKSEVTTPEGNALVISLPKATPLLQEGAPDIPKLTASLIIPDMAAMDIEVTGSEYVEYHNISIAPSKGNLYRDTDPSAIPYTYGREYAVDAFFPGKLAGLRDPYIARDYRGQTVVIYPFQYNPVTRVLRVYTKLSLKVFATGKNGMNPLERTREMSGINREFFNVYNQHFLNAGSTRYAPVEEYGHMLIISYGDFIDEMQDFADWQVQKGTPCEIIDISTIGNNASAIKSYISNYYNTHGLTYVLLVGDHAQVSSSYSSGDSDNEYTYLSGSDHYPDILIGRFSAENENHVQTQVERTLEYEKNPYTGDDWFTNAIGIASDQGPGDDNEYDYEHIRNINTDLLGFTYEYAYELFDGSQGGEDEPGNPTPAQVAEAINNGSSIINYPGHGSTTSWGTSGFSNSNVASLTNEHMWPFIFSVACVNGNFTGSTCFAEAWLRAENNGNPTGAIATIMSTINQSWNPPMCGQDEMNDILCELKEGNIKRSFAGIALNGCMQMNDEYGSGGDEMTDTWTVFGDPSVFVRTAMPETMTATYQNVTFIGTTEIMVTSDAEGGLVCLTYQGDIMATALIENGTATLTFPELEELGTINITITAFNFLPHTGTIQIIQPNGPYLVYEDHDVNDQYGNNNGSIDYGESVLLDLTLENMGLEDGINIETSISTPSSWIVLSDNTEVFELIPSQGTATVFDGYAFRVENNVPDMTEVSFSISASNGEATWESAFSATIHAPVINIGDIAIIEGPSCNGNGIIDPGETVELKIGNANAGHSVAYETIGSIEINSPYITLVNNTDTVGNIAVLQNMYAVFTIIADSATPPGENLVVEYELGFAGYSCNQSFMVEVGMLLEDWETADFAKFNWAFEGNQDWMVTNHHHNGSYSAVSGNISNNETSSLVLDIEANMYDEISFWYMVSSESNRDKLQFFVDGNLKGEWSGITGWNFASFPVYGGNHTLKWTYVKDGLLSFGEDCAWIDDIIFPAMPVLNAFAGPDNYCCQGMDFQCQGIALNYSAIEWTTSGDGVFSNSTIETPLYSPGNNDIASGDVTLTMEVSDNEGNSDTDHMTLTITGIPTPPSQPMGPTVVITWENPASQYVTSENPFVEHFIWSLEPESAGSIYGSSNVSEVSWNNDFKGTATIYAIAVNNCGSSNQSETLEVLVNEYVGMEPVKPEYWELYPNPAKNLISVSFNNFSGPDVNFKLLDITGSVVIKKTFNVNQNNTHTLNIEHLNEGLYFVAIETNKNQSVQKLIINK